MGLWHDFRICGIVKGDNMTFNLKQRYPESELKMIELYINQSNLSLHELEQIKIILKRLAYQAEERHEVMKFTSRLDYLDER